MANQLSNSQQLTLRAVIDRLIPPDDGPGALDVGVDFYIERLIATELSIRAKETLKQGLDQVQQLAKEAHNECFQNCKLIDQDAVLTRFQRRADDSQLRFFNILMTLTIEGFFCDPTHGGNKGRAGWKLIDFTPKPHKAASS